MKLRKLFGNWTNAIQTFPVSHILLVILTIIGILQIEGIIDLDSPDIILSLILAFMISCYGPLFLIHSKIKNKNLINRILQIGSVILGGLYNIVLYNIELDDLTYSEGLLYLRILPLVLLGIPLIIALLHRKSESKIRFSRTSLFIAIVFGGIAGSIVRGGISGALASIEALFDIYIDSDLYSDIGFISNILLAGSFVFNYYLTLTEDINKKSDLEIKPSRLRKIFGSFIFLPLALIYLVIFAVYGIKILITGIRPKGIIILLGIGYFALGMVSIYLIYPDKTKVHEIMNKILYISFILMSFLMIGAIAKRINQYGITINRCFVCYIIAFIMIFSALSLIFPKKRLLSFVSTLGILAFLAVYGWPINVNHISFTSQVNRLETFVSKENLSLPLNEGDLKDVGEDSTKSIISVIDGLVQNYNKNEIINKIINYEYENSYRSSRSEIREFLGIDPDYDSYYYPTFKYRTYNQYGQESIDVQGFSKLSYFGRYENFKDNVLKIDMDSQKYEFDLTKYISEFQQKADIYAKSDLSDEERNILQQPALILEEENYKLVITGFTIEEDDEGVLKIIDIQGYILVR